VSGVALEFLKIVSDNVTIAQGKHHTHTHTMAGALPHLGGLSVNGDAPPAPPTAVTFNDLPPDVVDAVLERYLEKVDVDKLCEARLLEICQVARTSSWRQCSDPNDGLWKAACARFGLTERLVGAPSAPATPTWRHTFLAMCKDVADVAMLSRVELKAYKGLLRGDDAYEDGPFSDDDADEEATPQRRLRREVQKLWYHAARHGLLCMVHFLLRHVDEIVNYDDGDDVALSEASANGHLAVVEFLLAHGADVHANDDLALRLASLYGEVAIVEVLLAHGADVHGADDAALRDASLEGEVAVVEVLLARGADVNAQNSEGETALRNASDNGHFAVVQVLLARGANVNARNTYGSTALIGASRNGHLAVVRLLLEHDANVKLRTNQGFTALRSASNHGHRYIVEALRAAGATE